MHLHSLRTHLATASAGLASLLMGCTSAGAPPNTLRDDTVAELIERSRASNALLMRGAIDEYAELLSFSDDFTLFSPFGGEPTRGPLSPDAMARMGRFFRDGTHAQELVQAYGTDDMVVLAIIERANVVVGGLPAQDWALRVTLVYRRDGEEWVLVHRHADPLVAGITLSEAAVLGRGEGWEAREEKAR